MNKNIIKFATVKCNKKSRFQKNQLVVWLNHSSQSKNGG